MIKCLYCGEEKEPSESHIIPEALCNNGLVLEDAVCRECNNLFGKVEQPIIKGYSMIRSAMGIKGKRYKLPRFKIEAVFYDQRLRIKVYDPSDLYDRALTFNRDKTKYIIGPNQEVELLKEIYERRNPGVVWHELPEEEKQNLYINIQFDYTFMGTEEGLRVASKIAFEWLCREKGDVNLLLGHEYDDIREYIMSGIKPNYPIACVVTHPHIIKGLGNTSFGIHYIVFSYSYQSHEIVAIVSLFGLVYYKIVIAKRYPISLQKLSLAIVHPQNGEVYEPMLRGQLKDPKLYGYHRNDNIEPLEAIKILSPEIKRKLNQSGLIITE